MNGDAVKVWTRLRKDYADVTAMGYKVLGVFLQGSQNYNLDYDGSDIDTKAIILPSFEDVVLNRKPVSTTHIGEDNTHIDLKDIRLMWKCFRKQNINFLETLFTDYYVVSHNFAEWWEEMRKIAEDVAHYNNYAAVNCIAGMVFEKAAALCHPYPTLKDKIDRYGYCNKQLHHIVRCREFLDRFIAGVPYKECLIPQNPAALIKLKSEYNLSLQEAKAIADGCVREVKAVKQDYMDTHKPCINDDVFNKMQEVLVAIMRQSLRDDLWK